MMTFGDRFKAWRKAHSVSGWVIEKQIKLSRPNLSSLEAGRYVPSDDVLKEIASISQLSITFTRLRAWKALDEYTKEELAAALAEAD